MATQAVRQYREPIALGLIGIAFVYLACGLALLFKSYDNHSYGFAVRAALDGHVFTSPVIVVGLAVAVFLVAAWGEPSPRARTIVLAAIAIGAVALVFAVVAWIAALTADEIVPFAGVAGAGKVTGAFLGLAQIALLGVSLFFAGTVLQSLPRPVRVAPQWGPPYQQPGWAPNQEWQQGGQWAAPQHQPPPPPPWSASPGQQSWGPGAQPQPPGWGQPSATQAEHGWQQPAPEGQHSESAEPEQTSWQPFDEAAPGAEPSQTSVPAHAAEPAHIDPSAEPDEVAGSDDEPTTTMGSWSSGSTASASEVAADDADADDGGEASEEPQTDDSGWWRPSSS